MLLNYLRVAYRNLKRNKLYLFINITGLSIGLASFILLLMYIRYEFSFDKYHAHATQLYRVATEFHGHDHEGLNLMAYSRGPLAPALEQECPEILAASRIKTEKKVKLLIGNESFYEESVYFADPSLFEIFTLPSVRGNTSAIRNDPFSVIISEQVAKKYYGDRDPIGKTIRYMGEFDFQIAAVMKDMPRNSHFIMDIIFPLEAYTKITDYDLSSWRGSSCYTYLLVTKSANIIDLENKINEVVQKYTADVLKGEHTHRRSFFLQPLIKIHLYSQLYGEIAPNSDIKNIYLFSTIAFLILLIACFNYMNLATAQSVKRGKEVGIRKTVGAERGHLIKQFMSESFLLTLFSFLISIFLVELILPSFNSFFERELHYSFIDDLTLVLWLIALFLLVSLFSGSYPAFLLSSFRPLKIIDRTVFIKQGKIPLRNLFVVLQFTISIILIISTIIIKGQLEHVFTTDVGYQKDQIVTLKIRGEQAQEKLEILKSELLKNPNILMTSSSTYLPNWIRDQTDFNWPGKPDHIKVRCYVSFVDYDYIDLYGIEVIEGRNFSRDYPSDSKGAFILNETAVKELGWKEPLMHQLTNWEGITGQVVGVVKDFNLHSLHRKIDPLYLFFEPKRRNYFLSIKIAGGNLQQTIDFVKNKMTYFSPEYPVEYSFFDDIFSKTYHKELRMDHLFTLFAIIAIFISCLGLFGLTLYTTEKRTKEIGIRKVLGASSSHILSMLSREFIKWILLANLIAWPIAAFFMQRWLENFAYRIDLNLWIFLAAGGIALLFALITVYYQTWKAALSNPIKALRYE